MNIGHYLKIIATNPFTNTSVLHCSDRRGIYGKSNKLNNGMGVFFSKIPEVVFFFTYICYKTNMNIEMFLNNVILKNILPIICPETLKFVLKKNFIM
ncbi:Protein of unknown function [Gryllus bimaculatus]|nr:Protein of unknown function [Gryllus bimaculatus]